MDAPLPYETPGRIFRRFLRFGMLAWGGPVAQIAMIRRELVDQQQWVSSSRFNRLLAIYQVLPGPEAHELCVHFGMMKGRWLGGLLAGLGFLLPGLLLVMGIAFAYQRIDLGQPLVAALFLGVQVGVIAIIARAVHRIGGHCLHDRWLLLVGALCAAGAALGVSFWITLPAAGLAYAALRARRTLLAAVVVGLAAALAFILHDGRATVALAAAGPLVAAGSVGALALFWSGLKAGLLTFGGAYTAIPFVRDDAVGKGWLSDAQFLDGLALCGMVPAPLIIFATFVGYIAGGPVGALAMTAGIFLPAFAFGTLLHDRLEAVIEDARLHHLLEGVAAGVVGLIAVTAVQMALHVAGRVPSLWGAGAIVAAGLALLYAWKSALAVPAVVALSAVAGLLFFA